MLYVGRLGREKGIFELLEAAWDAPAPWPLRIVGAGSWMAAITARADQLGLGERVSFQPFASSRRLLARMYAEASCVVMPGAYEPFGLVGLEAAASGARVVACTTAPSAGLAGALAATFSWERAFAAELADLERVVRARGGSRTEASRAA